MAGEPHENPLKYVVGFVPPGSRRQPSPPRPANLTRGDVTNQGRVLMTHFIHDRMVREGMRQAPESDSLIRTGTPSGPPVHRLREVAGALRRIGDELDGDVQLQRLIDKIPPDAPRQTFMNVAREIFADGNFNWGRVTALFYFAYKMIVKAINAALSSIPFLQGIVECVSDFLYDNVSPWIIERGGWEAVFEYFTNPTPNQQLVTRVIVIGTVALAAFALLKYLNRKS